MKNNKDYQKAGFTLVEIVIVMTIIVILGSLALSGYQWAVKNAQKDAEYQEISFFGIHLQDIIQKEGDVPTQYCKNSSGFLPNNTQCLKTPSIGQCSGELGDGNSTGCDSGCIQLNCVGLSCSNEETRIDFEKMFFDNKIQFSFKNPSTKFFIKLCPYQTENIITSGKAFFYQKAVFNPSFNLGSEGINVYRYHSSP